MVVDVTDTVTYTNFGEHRLRGFWVAWVKFSPFPLTLIVALTTLSHYRASVRCRVCVAGQHESRWVPPAARDAYGFR